MLRSANCPVVEVMDTDGDPVGHCVGVSHLEAGRDMARKIVERGFRKIGFIGTKLPQDFRAIKRLDGFREELRVAGLELFDQEHYSGESSIQTGRMLTEKILARSPDIECLYYSSDVLSVGGYMHALAAGLSVPRDIALAGFNKLQILEGMPLALATTDACRREIGVRAAEIILKGGDSSGPRIFERMQSKIALGESL
jgi:LacI family gluconate utilization system Gnt-I transcriptional repressor